MADFTKDEIVIGDIEINDDCSGVSSYIETHFDVDKKFGTHINDEDDSWVNFYAEYSPENKELKCEYCLHTPTTEECRLYIPSAEERQLIIFAMEEYTQDNYGENIMEFIAREREEMDFEKSITLGGM